MMKQLGVFVLSLGGMLVHPGVTPSIKYPFIHLGGERCCESKVSCLRTQGIVHGQDWNRNSLPDAEMGAVTMRSPSPLSTSKIIRVINILVVTFFHRMRILFATNCAHSL